MRESTLKERKVITDHMEIASEALNVMPGYSINDITHALTTAFNALTEARAAQIDLYRRCAADRP